MKNTNANKNRRPYFPPLVFLAAFLIGVITLAAQKSLPSIKKEFILNEPAPRTVFSPFHVAFIHEVETRRLREEKRSQLPPVYTLDPKVNRLIFSQVNGVFKEFAEAEEADKPEAFQFPWPLSPSSREFLLRPGPPEEISRVLPLLFQRFSDEGILEDARKKELSDAGKTVIKKLNPETKTEVEQILKDAVSVSEAKDKAGLFLEREGIKGRELKTAALEIFSSVVRPNLFFDESRTETHRSQAARSVAPVMKEVKRGEMIVQKGLLVTPEQQERLLQVHRKMAKKQVQSRLLTVSLFIFLGLGLAFLYLKQFEPKQFHSPRFLLLVLTTLLVTLIIERLTLLIPNSSSSLLPGALAAILLTILWSPGLGILGALCVSILSTPLTEFHIETVLMLLLGSLTASFAARGIRKRIHFLKVGLAVGAINAVVLVGTFAFQDWQLSEALALGPLGLANGFLVTALAFFLVPLFESLFNLTTDITLLELSDLNHPLLKRMVVEAPGTYHHSLVVSTLAEAACEAIGANALLARVGCYFHDIGKIARSEYFTENQTPQSGDRHEKLTPTMSCLVIMNHVKEGIELAKRYKLKDVIIRFIPEHQGKGVIYYFYKKALDQAAPGEEVNADNFRYSGPKPQSRETAVALLADSAEASSRSLKEITPAAIRILVRKVINEKFIDGQLDECDLTLKDLHKIQESFVHNLMAIFHTRVSYPTNPPDPRRPDIFESDQFEKFR